MSGTKKTPHPDASKIAMDPADIQAEITKQKGWNIVRIAKKVERSPTYVRDVIHGRRQSLEIARFIAELIKRPIHHIWGDEYDNQTARQLSRAEARQQRLAANAQENV